MSVVMPSPAVVLRVAPIVHNFALFGYVVNVSGAIDIV